MGRTRGNSPFQEATPDLPEAFHAFLEQLRDRYGPLQVFLFGSRASREALIESDYDLLLVSEHFSGIPFTDRLTPIYLLWPLEADLDCLALTPEEFEQARQRISLVRKIAEEGVQL